MMEQVVAYWTWVLLGGLEVGLAATPPSMLNALRSEKHGLDVSQFGGKAGVDEW